MLEREQAYFNLGVSRLEDETTKNYFSQFPEEMIASFLEAFIINKPMSGKVGGDGFWVYQDGDYLYIVVFDCMGHGHLASMMTRIYVQSFQKVVEKNQVQDPGEILCQVHEEIATRFKGKSNLQVGTGADTGILRINLSIREIEFASAKIDLLHVVDGELEVIKADRMQIGEMFEYDHTYTTKKIALKDGIKSNFYLSSDGFRDLIGGPENKKLGKNRVADVLVANYGMPLIKQKEVITSFMNDWSGSNDQLDDVLVIGLAI